MATDFTGSGNTIDISEADQEFKIQIQDANITVIAGNTKPTSSVTSLTAIPEAPAAPEVRLRRGEHRHGELHPARFELEVPAET